jgi:hypothetical protein
MGSGQLARAGRLARVEAMTGDGPPPTPAMSLGLLTDPAGAVGEQCGSATRPCCTTSPKRAGSKGSGQGRMRGIAVIDNSVEYEHVAFAPGITATPK